MFAAEPASPGPSSEDGLSALRDKVRKHVASCHLTTLFDDSCTLPGDALEVLFDVLVYFAHGPVNAQQVTYAYSEEAAVFFLEQLVDVTLRNKDRSESLWPKMTQHLKRIFLEESTSGYLYERAVVCQLRLLVRLIRRESLQAPVAQRMHELSRSLSFEHGNAALQCAHGLHELAKQSSATLQGLRCWDAVFTLLNRTLKGTAEMAAVLDTLMTLINDLHMITGDSLTGLVGTLVNCSNLVRQDPGGLPFLSQTAKARSRPESTSAVARPPPLLGVRVLDTIQHLYTRALSSFPVDRSDVDATAVADQLWVQCWQPLLKAVSDLVLHSHSNIWQLAIATLERFLLFPDLQHLSADNWKGCVDSILFDLIRRLLGSNPHLKSGSLEELRTRSCSLICKVFLRKVDVLKTLEAFTTIWFRLLELMDRLMAAQQQGLREAVPEQVKNLLMVLSSCGVLVVSRVVWLFFLVFFPLHDRVFNSRCVPL